MTVMSNLLVLSSLFVLSLSRTNSGNKNGPHPSPETGEAFHIWEEDLRNDHLYPRSFKVVPDSYLQV